MSSYRKKPVVIDAFLWTGGPDQTEDPEWIVAAIRAGTVDFDNPGTPEVKLVIHTLEGDMRADQGDWIIRGVKGELYPCKPDIFAATYEPASAHDGVSLIAAERRRQINDEGWSPEHDDEHDDGQLATAAACYAAPEKCDGTRPRSAILAHWPWLLSWWKPTPTHRIRELVKAGALCAAEIDRLKRAAKES